MREWYKGDTHLHTTNSDGVLSKGQLVDACKKKGLDFMIITDHNFNSVKESYYDGDMLIIQGQELTDYNGHVNIWGKKVPVEPPYKLETADDYSEIIDACKNEGAVVSVNHPFCSNCPFRLDLEEFAFDCIEVWNTIQHSDNMKNRDWWVSQLLKGKKIAAVGGSDYHDNRAGLPLLAMPTTIVHAEDKSEKAILEALVQGRSVVTNTPNSTMIYLTCGNANVGDTVKLNEHRKAQLKVTDLKRGHTIRIYNNEKVIFEHKASKNAKIFSTEADIEQEGFIRCEITYKLPVGFKQLYSLIEKKILHITGEVPDFIWAFTNPIWIE